MKKYLFVLSLFFLFPTSISYAADLTFTKWLLQCFPAANPEDIVIQPLTGGLSATSVYKIEVQKKPYVLRIHHNFSEQDQREHAILLEAAKRKLAPSIIAISADHKAIIMEFIDEQTLSIEQAKEPEILKKIAEALFLTHQISSSAPGETILSKASRCVAKVLADGIEDKERILLAFELLKSNQERLLKLNPSEVNVHGDLNPRNIFYADNLILLIDWAETHKEDPFYDLSFFALKHDYTENDEFNLLKEYLKRAPNEIERERFTILKKIHNAFWSLTNLYLTKAALDKNPNQKIDKNESLKPWGYYQQVYAEGKELSAQYFYDLSRLNYQLAQ